jgi:hypothetical protein
MIGKYFYAFELKAADLSLLFEEGQELHQIIQKII